MKHAPLSAAAICSGSSQLRYIYAACFTLELLARLLAFGLGLFLSDDGLWSVLDVIIVCSFLGFRAKHSFGGTSTFS